MVLKIVVLVVTCCVLLGLGIKLSQQPQGTYESWKSRHSLHSVAKKTKAEGKSSVTIPGPRIEYAGENMSLQDALSKLSVVVVEPIESKSYINGDDKITTWYHCRLTEIISIRPSLVCDGCPKSPEPPVDAPSTKLGEVLIPKVGGSVMVDGVQITMSDVEMPDFGLRKRYLMFLSIMPNGTAMLTGGATSVFEITDTDRLEPITKNSHLKSDMENRFGLKLSKFKANPHR